VTLDDRRLRWLLAAALAVLGLGLWFFVLRGADQPDDPFLTEEPGSSGEGTAPGDPARRPLAGFGELAVEVERPGVVEVLAWCLLAAIEPQQRSRGLMEVTDLQGYSGMAFVYPEDSQNAFYMRNTPMPLSIAWIAADGSVVSTADMEPCEDREGCPTYPPAGPYRMAIEVPQGQLDDLGIVEGATVRGAGACAARG
jgi:uncharacterized membrane protein (UPF0127 family)